MNRARLTFLAAGVVAWSTVVACLLDVPDVATALPAEAGAASVRSADCGAPDLFLDFAADHAIGRAVFLIGGNCSDGSTPQRVAFGLDASAILGRSYCDSPTCAANLDCEVVPARIFSASSYYGAGGMTACAASSGAVSNNDYEIEGGSGSCARLSGRPLDQRDTTIDTPDVSQSRSVEAGGCTVEVVAVQRDAAAAIQAFVDANSSAAIACVVATTSPSACHATGPTIPRRCVQVSANTECDRWFREDDLASSEKWTCAIATADCTARGTCGSTVVFYADSTCTSDASVTLNASRCQDDRDSSAYAAAKNDATISAKPSLMAVGKVSCTVDAQVTVKVDTQAMCCDTKR